MMRSKFIVFAFGMVFSLFMIYQKHNTWIPTSFKENHHMQQLIKISETLPIESETSPEPETKNITPPDAEVLAKRDHIRDMMKFAWDGYRKHAWGYNVLGSRDGHPARDNIFGSSRTGATIVDSLDTLWIMGLKDEFAEGAEWVRTEFDLTRATNEMSSFETVIRFVGGLLGAYHMSGDYMFVEKAVKVAEILDVIFKQSALPSGHFNPTTGATDSDKGRILTEIGSFHLEYYDLTQVTKNSKWLDRVLGIRNLVKQTETLDGLYFNRISKPSKNNDGTWHVKAESKSISLGAEGDSFYEYLLKAYLQSGHKDTDAKEMFENMYKGAKKWLLTNQAGTIYLADYPKTSSSMQHLTCFAGGMFALGAQISTAKDEMFKMAEDIVQTCHQSYHNSPVHLGSERFSITRSGFVTTGNPSYYILRPEVIESYFYLWRLTKDKKYREWAWEAAQALDKYCRVEYGYSGIYSVSTKHPSHDNIQRTFFLAETLKYLYLIFSEDDLIPLDKFVFNTEAHPLPIHK